jgi:hypothetical protein
MAMARDTIFVSFADAHIVNAYSAAAKTADLKKRDAWQKALVEAVRAEAKTVDAGFAKDFKEIIEQPGGTSPRRIAVMRSTER